ncbi:hypothetical protein TREPR_2088 [Treponema primitia ZAS-2]|uniref:Uncharacterized protein n=1 Tax=Treponema primitia (strain ATCC BAA-887 / DSM 12427 / ZAS-2) TaxID=545694 RepID=F5YJQ1_TREPZ|nr:hypothetical protein TREPR_2088 [Treponema primitia ZAS-2]
MALCPTDSSYTVIGGGLRGQAYQAATPGKKITVSLIVPLWFIAGAAFFVFSSGDLSLPNEPGPFRL